MAVEVACPSCRSTLRAPEEAAGKRVRCKKCDHRFRIPGGDPLADSGGDSQLLSAVDLPPPRPSVVAPSPGNPFAFDGGPPPADEDEAEDEDREEREEREERQPRRRSNGNNTAVVLVAVGVLALVVMGSVAAGVYFLLPRDATIVATATSASRVVASQPTAAETRPTAAETRRNAAPEPPPLPDPSRLLKKENPATSTKDRPPPPKASGQAAAPALALPNPPAKPAIVAKPKVRVEMEVPPGTIRGIRFATGNPPVAGVLWKSFPGFQGSGAKDTLDLYSLSTGRRMERTEFVADSVGESRQFELSKDGRFVAIEMVAGRVTVYDFETKQKPLDLVDPFEGGLLGTIAAMRFLSPDKLLVFDYAGGLALWDLKEKKRLVYGRPVGPTGGKAPVAAVSGVCGDRVFVGVPGGLVAVGVGTGEQLGAPTTLANPNWIPITVAADSAGKQAAVVYHNPGATPAYGLTILPIGGGRGVTANVAIPEVAGVPVGVAMPTDLVVAVQTDKAAGGFLYDLENNAMAAYVRSPGTAVFQAGQPDGSRHWWVSADPKDDKKSVLVGVEVPFDGYFGVVNEAKADRKPVYLVPQPDGLAK